MKTRRFAPEFQPSRLEPLEQRNLFAATPITFIDGDGTTVKISLAGNGSMVFTPGDNDLQIIGADQGTRLTITTKGGDGRATLGSIDVGGAIKSINAKTTDFTGNISILGSVSTLTLGNMLPGDQKSITIGGTSAAKPATINLGRITDLNIDSGTPLNGITVIDWDDTDNNDIINAPFLKKVSSKEDFAAGAIIISEEEGKASLGKITLKGQLDGFWYVDGKAAGISTGSTAQTFRMNVRGKLNNLSAKTDVSGLVAAADIGAISISGSVIDAVILAGADLGTDVALGGAGDDADLFFSGTLAKLTVKGGVTNSTFGAGLDPANGILGDGDDFVTGKLKSTFGGISIKGIADVNTTFAAGKFSKPRIGGTSIDPAGDPRFLIASTAPDILPPVITAQLGNNTGDPNDNITSDPTIIGRVIDLGEVKTFRFGIDDDQLSDFINIRNLIEEDGTFELPRATIEKVNKGPLSVGLHNINFFAVDEIGNTAAIFTVTFFFAP